MRITKAVITAAGRGPRLYPAADTVQKAMQPIVDRDGLAKPVIQIIAEEALASGVEELCVVCAPGDEERYLSLFASLRENMLQAHQDADWATEQAGRIDRLLKSLTFAPQADPLGYGHAVYTAKDFVGEESFLLLLGDHLYVSHAEGRHCSEQLIETAIRESCAVAAVQATREHLVGRYGTLSGKRIPGQSGLYAIEKILEKPSLSLAELNLHTPGLRVGHYLCLFGMHVLPHRIFSIVEAHMAEGDYQLTPALQELADREAYRALEVHGKRYDIGGKFGLMQAQIALGLAGKSRDSILASLLELLAEADGSRP